MNIRGLWILFAPLLALFAIFRGGHFNKRFCSFPFVGAGFAAVLNGFMWFSLVLALVVGLCTPFGILP
jgi:hypothetical protein